MTIFIQLISVTLAMEFLRDMFLLKFNSRNMVFWLGFQWLNSVKNNSNLLSVISVKNHFLTISYLFSIPKNCSNLKFHCPLEVLHMEKIGKNIFPGWKKIVLLGKIFFLVGIFFPIFPHEKIGKVKKIFCYHNCPDLSLFE